MERSTVIWLAMSWAVAGLACVESTAPNLASTAQALSDDAPGQTGDTPGLSHTTPAWGAPPPGQVPGNPAHPAPSAAVKWDDFSTPTPAFSLTVTSAGVTNAYRETAGEWDLRKQTGSLRNFRIRHTEVPNGVTVSQFATIGEGLINYLRTTTAPGTYASDFLELQYDNAPGGSSVGGEPFDLTGGGQYDTMVLHFDHLVASTLYESALGHSVGSRVCIGLYGGPIGIFPLRVPTWWTGGGGCPGVVLRTGDNQELAITYTDFFQAPLCDTPCVWVEEHILTTRQYEMFCNGVTYQDACLTPPSLAQFSQVSALLIGVDGADEVVMSGITLEHRQ
jgi:hypothetical protein